MSAAPPPQGGGEETDWWGGAWENFKNASDEALDIIFSAFNLSHAPAHAHGSSEGVGWGSVNAEGEGRKQFFFGDPSEYDLSEINGPRSQWSLFKSNLKGFVQAIEWTEPWLIGLGCFHLVLLVTAVATRRYHTVQMGLYVVIMGSVFFAERLNALAGAHWESLGFTQNYFDKKGVFICSLWSTPLLLIGAVMLLQSLYTSASLLIKVKRKQIQGELRNKARDTKRPSQDKDSKKSQ